MKMHKKSDFKPGFMWFDDYPVKQMGSTLPLTPCDTLKVILKAMWAKSPVTSPEMDRHTTSASKHLHFTLTHFPPQLTLTKTATVQLCPLKLSGLNAKWFLPIRATASSNHTLTAPLLFLNCFILNHSQVFLGCLSWKLSLTHTVTAWAITILHFLPRWFFSLSPKAVIDQSSMYTAHLQNSWYYLHWKLDPAYLLLAACQTSKW